MNVNPFFIDGTVERACELSVLGCRCVVCLCIESSQFTTVYRRHTHPCSFTVVPVRRACTMRMVQVLAGVFAHGSRPLLPAGRVAFPWHVPL